MSLFQWGNFTLHSGQKSWWRIDCDALSDSEVALFAQMILERARPFSIIASPPSHPGSAVPRLVEAIDTQKRKAMKQWRHFPSTAGLLVVDDVLTTGASMEQVKQEFGSYYEAEGFVLFARGQCPAWITPLFALTPTPDAPDTP